ncbi:MAG: hypothetical protein VKK63_12095 [Synechococcus sp.]|nr:hypothetical protein [Synechococcus sp.]
MAAEEEEEDLLLHFQEDLVVLAVVVLEVQALEELEDRELLLLVVEVPEDLQVIMDHQEDLEDPVVPVS